MDGGSRRVAYKAEQHHSGSSGGKRLRQSEQTSPSKSDGQNLAVTDTITQPVPTCAERRGVICAPLRGGAECAFAPVIEIAAGEF